MAISTRDRFDVIVSADFTCHYCGERGATNDGPDGRAWHIDHVIPRSKGGRDERANYVLACATCNLAKRAAPYVEFVAVKIEQGSRPAPLRSIARARDALLDAAKSRRANPLAGPMFPDEKRARR